MEKATIKSLGKALKGEFLVQRDIPDSVRKALRALAAAHDGGADDNTTQMPTPPGTTSSMADGQ
jgi:plasmid stability protein